MGIGGIGFRVRALAGAVGVALAAGCRSGGGVDDLGAAVHVGEAGAGPAAAVEELATHRFGRWLALAPDAQALEPLWDARELERAGALEEAIACLGAALDDGPQCASLFEARGALYVATRFPRAAAGDFQRAVALAPERASGWFALGHAYEVLGLSRQALEALERARGLGAEDAEVHLSTARVSRALGRRGTAARHYELALARLEPAPTPLLVEVVTLVTEDAGRAAAVRAQRVRLESCRGTVLTDDGWLLRALVGEMSGAGARDVAATFHALDVPDEELARMAESLLLACQLADPTTAGETRARLLAAERDEARRAALERCLQRP